jgi:hypothetical protein
MKTALIFALTFITHSFVQSQGLPFNNSGKIEMTEVVQLDSINKKFLLYQNAMVWLSSFPSDETKITKQEKDEATGSIKCEFQFPVYTQTNVGVLKKINGMITYSFNLDVKDHKYRYSFTNFIYHYYKQDRNYKYVDTGKKKNLEDMKASGWQKLWDKHRLLTAKKIEKDINSLKATLLTIPSEAIKTEPKKEVKWED